jgi:hypothetical protein
MVKFWRNASFADKFEYIEYVIIGIVTMVMLFGGF